MAAKQQTEVQRIQAEIRETRAEMKELGVRRISCFNGGLSPIEYQFNNRIFQLETQLSKAKTHGAI
jgi:hypothetical protein